MLDPVWQIFRAPPLISRSSFRVTRLLASRLHVLLSQGVKVLNFILPPIRLVNLIVAALLLRITNIPPGGPPKPVTYVARRLWLVRLSTFGRPITSVSILTLLLKSPIPPILPNREQFSAFGIRQLINRTAELACYRPRPKRRWT